MTSPLDFKARAGSTLFAFFCRGECTVHSPRSTTGAICTNLLVAGSVAGHFPTCISRGGIWLGFERAITSTEDERATIVSATRLMRHSDLTHACICHFRDPGMLVRVLPVKMVELVLMSMLIHLSVCAATDSLGWGVQTVSKLTFNKTLVLFRGHGYNIVTKLIKSHLKNCML